MNTVAHMTAGLWVAVIMALTILFALIALSFALREKRGQ